MSAGLFQVAVATRCLVCSTISFKVIWTEGNSARESEALRNEIGLTSQYPFKEPQICFSPCLTCTEIATQVPHIIPKEYKANKEHGQHCKMQPPLEFPSQLVNWTKDQKLPSTFMGIEKAMNMVLQMGEGPPVLELFSPLDQRLLRKRLCAYAQKYNDLMWPMTMATNFNLRKAIYNNMSPEEEKAKPGHLANWAKLTMDTFGAAEAKKKIFEGFLIGCPEPIMNYAGDRMPMMLVSAFIRRLATLAQSEWGLITASQPKVDQWIMPILACPNIIRGFLVGMGALDPTLPGFLPYDPSIKRLNETQFQSVALDFVEALPIDTFQQANVSFFVRAKTNVDRTQSISVRMQTQEEDERHKKASAGILRDTSEQDSDLKRVDESGVNHSS